jgi:Fur family ferric uptake transcriptional regulator
MDIETSFSTEVEYNRLLQKFKEILKRSGNKYTKQREVILQTLYSSDSHLTSEELYNKIRKERPECKIGIATVYRTLSLLEGEHFIVGLSTSDADAKRYELAYKKHHDHIICTDCGQIKEFVDNEIENRQEQVAESLGFSIKRHSMQIYGVCGDCQKINK